MQRADSFFRRRAAAALSALALAGCINLDLGGKGARPSLAYFDLAGSVAGNPSGNPAGTAPTVPALSAIGLRSVDVVAPSWLDAPAMQYRLVYSDPARRASFAESRWVAPPPELFEQALRKTMTQSDPRNAPGACRLQIDVDEFVQVFDTPQSSRGIIELRASLWASRADAPVARRAFQASRAAQTPDARGGVAALAGATGDMSAALRDWLHGLGEDPVIGAAVARRCRAD